MDIEIWSNNQAVQAHMSTTCVHVSESQPVHNMLVGYMFVVMVVHDACMSLHW